MSKVSPTWDALRSCFLSFEFLFFTFYISEFRNPDYNNTCYSCPVPDTHQTTITNIFFHKNCLKKPENKCDEAYFLWLGLCVGFIKRNDTCYPPPTCTHKLLERGVNCWYLLLVHLDHFFDVIGFLATFSGFPNCFSKNNHEIEPVVLHTLTPMKSKKNVMKKRDFFTNGECLGGK